MGPDDGVQRVLKTGLASAGSSYGVSIAVWMRGGKVFAEGRVFPRKPSSEEHGIVETIKVEAQDADLAVALLEKQVEKYGQLKQIHWFSTANAIEVGQRVWVADPEAKGGRATGAIASVADEFLGAGSFVVLVEGRKCVVTCFKDRRGTQWDFATD